MSKNLGTHNGWTLHQLDDGHFEAWMTISRDGKNPRTGKGIRRMVLLATNAEGAFKEIEERAKRPARQKGYNPHADSDQMRIE